MSAHALVAPAIASRFVIRIAGSSLSYIYFEGERSILE
jgi:hypothetical protein